MTNDAVAQFIINTGHDHGLNHDQVVACLATAIQESGLNQAAVGGGGQSLGVYQQDGSYPDRYTAAGNISGFFDRLSEKLAAPGASNDIWLNIFWLQQAPNRPTANLAYSMGRQAYLSEIKSRAAAAAALYQRLTGVMPVPDNTPDFNEFPIWSPNKQSRGGTTPSAFIIHTQEGGGGDAAAEDLANYLANPANQVSYHYSISQASDGGVTVVDCVDTDEASWSVGDFNDQSVNLCFAGSRSSWTTDEWMAQSNAIDVAAYLAVQDATKYGFSTRVVPPPYKAGTPGISDHKWVTQVFGWGTHTDVGDNFPWPFFAKAVAKYAGTTPAPQPTPTPAPAPLSDRQLLQEIWDQLRGPNGAGWAQLGGRTLVDAVAELLKASK